MKTDLKIALGAFAAYCAYIFHKAKKAKGTSGINGLSEGEFEELVRYVSDNIEHDLDRYAMRVIGNREPLPSELADPINDYAAEWCEEHDIDPSEYYSWHDAEDVFMHDAYAFDS